MYQYAYSGRCRPSWGSYSCYPSACYYPRSCWATYPAYAQCCCSSCQTWRCSSYTDPCGRPVVCCETSRTDHCPPASPSWGSDCCTRTDTKCYCWQCCQPRC